MYICNPSCMEGSWSSSFHCMNRCFNLSGLFKSTSQSSIKSILEVYSCPNYIFCAILFLKLGFSVEIGQMLSCSGFLTCKKLVHFSRVWFSIIPFHFSDRWVGTTCLDLRTYFLLKYLFSSVFSSISKVRETKPQE